MPIPGRPAALLSTLLVMLPSARVAAQEAERGTLRGTVVSGETGERLGFALIALEPPRLQRFADANGNFTIPGLPAGNYRLVVRQVGYRPFDTTLTLGASTPALRIALPRIAVQLSAINVAATGRCRVPSAPDPASDPELATVFEQLRWNAQRHALLLDQYPFRYTVERTLSDRMRNGMTNTAFDTLVIPSDGRWRYAPGNMVDDDPYRRGGRIVHFPILGDLADSAFQANHCFRFAGLDTLQGRSWIRVDWKVAESVQSPDVDGSAYLDPETYMVGHTRFVVTRVDRAASGVAAFTATARFRELVPNLIIVEGLEAFTTLQGYNVTSSQSVVGRIERQRLLRVDFLRAAP